MPLIGHKYIDYLSGVIVPLLLVTATAPLLPFVLSNNIAANDVMDFFTICIVSMSYLLLSIWLLGLKNEERAYLKEIVKTKMLKR